MKSPPRPKTVKGGVWIGVDIGGTKTAIVLSSAPPAPLARVEFATLPDRGPDRAIELIKGNIHAILSRSGSLPSELRAIGVSCGGPLDRLAGVIQAPPNLPTWIDVPVTSILRNEFAVECRLENDANAGAIAEHRFGAGKGTQQMVFLTMGTGFGAGIILDGRLYRGASDSAGEIGHVRLTRSGPAGYGKSGSVEGWASGEGMAQVATKAASAARKKSKATLLSQYLRKGRPLSAREVGLAAGLGDLAALRIIRSTGRRLGEALAILVDLLNPECIVIGGLAVHLGEALLKPARQTLRREALSSSADVCRVVPAALGERIGDVAALCVAKGY